MEYVPEFINWCLENETNSEALTLLLSWYENEYQKAWEEVLSNRYSLKDILEKKLLSRAESDRFLLCLTQQQTNMVAEDPFEGTKILPTFDKKAPLKKIGKYQILEKLGEGGMGVVYQVRHQELDQIFALKTMIAGEHASKEMIARFYREAQTAAKLKHSGIIQITDFGTENQLYYLVMELVNGSSLDQLIKEGLSIEKGVELIIASLKALHYAHRQGVIHRDLKPDNIFVNANGEPKIGDFGLAKDVRLDSQSKKLTQSGAIMGTPTYMPPEQVLGEIDKLDARTDVYAMGVCLYEVLTSTCPFDGNNLNELFFNIIETEPIPPTKRNPALPKDLETIILKAIAKNKSKRYQSAGLFAADLERFLKGEPITAKPISSVEKIGYWLKRNRQSLFFSCSLFVLFLTVSLVAFLYNQHQKKLQKEERQDLKVQKYQTDLQDWLTRLTGENLKKSTKEDAIFAISQMQAPEIREQLESIVQEGVLYFLAKKKRKSGLEDYYHTIVIALGRLGQKKSGKALLKALKEMQQKISLGSNKEPISKINFMVSLANALGNLGEPRHIKGFKAIRHKMGRNRVFWRKTAAAYNKLAVLYQGEQPELLAEAGYSNFCLGEKEEAFRFFEKAIKLDPKCALAFNLRGMMYQELKEFEKATEDFSRAISCEPKYEWALLNRAQLYFIQEKMDLAIADYTKVLDYDVDPCEALLGRAMAYQKVAKMLVTKEKALSRKKFKKYLNDFSKAINHDPKFVRKYYPEEYEKFKASFRKRASLRWKQGKLIEALHLYNKVIELVPHGKAYSDRGAIKIQMKQFDKALKDLNIALKTLTTDANTYNYRAIVYMTKGQLEDALEDFNLAIAYGKGKYSEPYLHRAQILQRLKRPREALQDFELYLKKEPNHLEKKEIKKRINAIKEELRLK